MNDTKRIVFIVASLVSALEISAAANSEEAKLPPVVIDITRGNAVIHGHRTDMFGQEMPVAISPSGIWYWEPGSKKETTFAKIYRSAGPAVTPFAAPMCPDGQPARMLYNFPGGPDCRADRPQLNGELSQ